MKVPPKPKAPLSSYFRYVKEKREECKANNPDIGVAELSKILSQNYA